MCDDYREYDDDTVHNVWVDYTAEQYEDNGNVSGKQNLALPYASFPPILHSSFPTDAIDVNMQLPKYPSATDTYYKCPINAAIKVVALQKATFVTGTWTSMACVSTAFPVS